MQKRHHVGQKISSITNTTGKNFLSNCHVLNVDTNKKHQIFYRKPRILTRSKAATNLNAQTTEQPFHKNDKETRRASESRVDGLKHIAPTKVSSGNPIEDNNVKINPKTSFFSALFLKTPKMSTNNSKASLKFLVSTSDVNFDPETDDSSNKPSRARREHFTNQKRKMSNVDDTAGNTNFENESKISKPDCREQNKIGALERLANKQRRRSMSENKLKRHKNLNESTSLNEIATVEQKTSKPECHGHVTIGALEKLASKERRLSKSENFCKYQMQSRNEITKDQTTPSADVTSTERKLSNPNCQIDHKISALEQLASNERRLSKSVINENKEKVSNPEDMCNKEPSAMREKCTLSQSINAEVVSEITLENSQVSSLNYRSIDSQENQPPIDSVNLGFTVSASPETYATYESSSESNDNGSNIESTESSCKTVEYKSPNIEYKYTPKFNCVRSEWQDFVDVKMKPHGYENANTTSISIYHHVSMVESPSGMSTESKSQPLPPASKPPQSAEIVCSPSSDDSELGLKDIDSSEVQENQPMYAKKNSHQIFNDKTNYYGSLNNKTHFEKISNNNGNVNERNAFVRAVSNRIAESVLNQSKENVLEIQNAYSIKNSNNHSMPITKLSVGEVNRNTTISLNSATFHDTQIKNLKNINKKFENIEKAHPPTIKITATTTDLDSYAIESFFGDMEQDTKRSSDLTQSSNNSSTIIHKYSTTKRRNKNNVTSKCKPRDATATTQTAPCSHMHLLSDLNRSTNKSFSPMGTDFASQISHNSTEQVNINYVQEKDRDMQMNCSSATSLKKLGTSFKSAKKSETTNKSAIENSNATFAPKKSDFKKTTATATKSHDSVSTQFVTKSRTKLATPQFEPISSNISRVAKSDSTSAKITAAASTTAIVIAITTNSASKAQNQRLRRPRLSNSVPRVGGPITSHMLNLQP